MLGGVFTVNVALVVGTLLPQLLLNRARYRLPLSAAVVVNVKLVLVAPALSVKLIPPSVLTCHWTVGAGLPLAVAVKLADPPAHKLRFAGLVVTVGGLLIATVVVLPVEVQPFTVTVTVYVPAATVVAFAMEGFWTDEVKPLGPVQL